MPTSREAEAVLEEYYHEVVSRYLKREARPEEVAGARDQEPSSDLVAPKGLMVLASVGGQTVGCGRVRFVSPSIAELTRAYVSVTARRSGAGTAIVSSLENRAREERATTIRLDTRRDILEAQELGLRGRRLGVPDRPGGVAFVLVQAVAVVALVLMQVAGLREARNRDAVSV